MFYRQKSYKIKMEFVENFNDLFNKINLPNQLKHGSNLVGRWMKPNASSRDTDIIEIFAIWQYNSYEEYLEIETKIQNDKAHIKHINDWYEQNGGREYVLKEYILEIRNEFIESTLKNNNIGSGAKNIYRQ